MHHRIADILTHFEKRLGEGVTEDPCWRELKDLLDGPASQVVKFQVANVSGMPGFSAYAAGSLVNAGSSSIPLEEGKGMVILDVEAHFNDTEVEAEDGSTIPELCPTHRRDLLVENLMHEFGHVLQDYFGKALRCDTIEAICAAYRRGLQETRALTLDFPGQHALSCWFGLSYASFLVLPRVLMEAMDDPWKERMAVLLKEFDTEFVNVPDTAFTVRITDLNRRLLKTPEWLLNYRHPDKAQIDSFRNQEIPDGQ